MTQGDMYPLCVAVLRGVDLIMSWGGAGDIEGEMGGERGRSGRTYGEGRRGRGGNGGEVGRGGGEPGMSKEGGMIRGEQMVVSSTGGGADGVSFSWLCLGLFQSVEGNVEEQGRSQCGGGRGGTDQRMIR